MPLPVNPGRPCLLFRARQSICSLPPESVTSAWVHGASIGCHRVFSAEASSQIRSIEGALEKTTTLWRQRLASGAAIKPRIQVLTMADLRTLLKITANAQIPAKRRPLALPCPGFSGSLRPWQSIVFTPPVSASVPPFSVIRSVVAVAASATRLCTGTDTPTKRSESSGNA